MSSLSFEPRINHPQASPFHFDPVQKEHYKVHHTKAPLYSYADSDTDACFDEEKHELLTKLRMRPEVTTIPHLAPPSQLVLAKAEYSGKGDDFGKILTISDSKLEKAVYAGMHDQRNLINEGAQRGYTELIHQQKCQKVIHEKKDALKEALEKRIATSENLKWVQLALTAVLMVVSVLAFAISLFVGFGGIIAAGMGVFSPIAGGISGAVGAANGAYSLRTQEQEGKVAALKIDLDLHAARINQLLTYCNDQLDKLKTHQTLVASSIRHWNVKLL